MKTKINTYHAASVRRRRVKNVNILKYGDYIIWNHGEKCIQISTSMPGICLEICEHFRILRNKTILNGW